MNAAWLQHPVAANADMIDDRMLQLYVEFWIFLKFRGVVKERRGAYGMDKRRRGSYPSNSVVSNSYGVNPLKDQTAVICDTAILTGKPISHFCPPLTIVAQVTPCHSSA